MALELFRSNPYTTPHHFDLKSGEVLLGKRAAEQALRTAPNPDTIRELGGLLLDRTTEIDPERYDRLDVDHWEMPDDYRRWGRWAHRLVTPPDNIFTNLSEAIIERTWRLGIGPYIRRITADARYGDLDNFYRRIGTAGRIIKGRYDHWDHERTADYVEHAFLAKPPGVILSDYLSQISRINEGPSPGIINRISGTTLRQLLDERGYPDVRSWDKDEYVDWGGVFMQANEGKRPTARKLDYLSKRHRGPSAKATALKFTRLSSYQDAVLGRYYQLETEATERRYRLSAALETRKVPRLVTGAVRSAGVPHWLGLRVGAQYLLLDSAIPEMSLSQKERLALSNQRTFMSGVVRPMKGNVHHLRGVAEDLGLSQDIWPAHNPEHLRVA